MLLVATLANTKLCWNPAKWLKPWQMGTHLRVLSESYPMNTNITAFIWFSKIVVPWTNVASASEGLSKHKTLQRICHAYWIFDGANTTMIHWSLLEERPWSSYWEWWWSIRDWGFKPLFTCGKGKVSNTTMPHMSGLVYAWNWILHHDFAP